MRFIKPVKERRLLETPIYVVEARVRRMILELYGSNDVETIFKKIDETGRYDGKILSLLEKIKNEYSIDFQQADFEHCTSLYDLICFVKRQLNTKRMIKTPKQYDGLDVPEIPNYSSCYSPQKKTINNIKPFNDIFCENCYFNVFYSAISSFHLEPFWFVGNELFLYSFSNGLFHMEKLEKTSSNLFPNFGIKTEVLSKKNQLILSIKEKIDCQCPVISEIDTFYIPSRKDSYLSDHISHFILIYGYDDTKQLFDIVEHDFFYDLKYKAIKLHYQDFYNSFYSHYKWFCEPKIVFLEKRCPCPQYSVDDIRLDYLRFFKRKEEIIIDGNKAIEVFKDYYLSSLRNDTIFWSRINPIISSIDNCINRGFTIAYLYNIIFPGSKICVLQNNIQKSWQRIVIVLKMVRIRGKASLENYMNHIDIINGIIRDENEKVNLILDEAASFT